MDAQGSHEKHQLLFDQLRGLFAGLEPGPQQQQCSSQLELLARQVTSLQRLVKVQADLGSSPSALNPLTPAPSSTHAAPGTTTTASQRTLPPAAPAVPVRPTAESIANTLKGEELLLSVFSVGDILNRDEARALALMAGCTEDHVRATFVRLRGTLRTVLTRVQRRASVATLTEASVTDEPNLGPGAAGLPDAAAYAARLNRQDLEQFEQYKALATVVEHGTGGLLANHTYAAHLLFNQMKTTYSWSHRGSQLRVIYRTPRGSPSLVQFVNAGAATLLNMWLREAEEDRQSTFLQSLLEALHHLPAIASLVTTYGLVQSVARLAKYKEERLAGLAMMLQRHWQPVVAAASRPVQTASSRAGGGAAELSSNLAAAAHRAVAVRPLPGGVASGTMEPAPEPDAFRK